MTIDEAIALLTAWKDTGEDQDSDKLDQAENLALEALRYVQRSRDPHGSPEYNLLPGETRS